MTTNFTSEANVEKAILSLLVKGANPSVEAIRSELALMFGYGEGEKKGSPNEILRVKRDWQEKVKETMEIPEPKHIPLEILSSFERIWEENLKVSSERFASERKEYSHAISVLEEEKNFLSVKNSKLESKLNSLENTLSSKDETIKSMDREIYSLNKRIGVLQESLDSVKLKNIEVEKFAAREKERCEKAQDSYNNLMERYGELSSQHSELTNKYAEVVGSILSKNNTGKE